MHVPVSIMAYVTHQAATRRRLGRFIRAVRPHHLRGPERREFNNRLRAYAARMLS